MNTGQATTRRRFVNAQDGTGLAQAQPVEIVELDEQAVFGRERAEGLGESGFDIRRCSLFRERGLGIGRRAAGTGSASSNRRVMSGLVVKASM